MEYIFDKIIPITKFENLHTYFKTKVHYYKMCGQTITTNHSIRLWVVFIWHKPLIILLNGQIPLETHQSGHVLRGNGGLGIFCPKYLLTWLKIFHSTFSNHLGGFS